MNKKSISTKLFVLLLAVVLLLGCTIGGTVAYLMHKTDTVTNTFSTSNIQITLTENTGSEYKLVPGKTYAKDPVVTVKKETDVDCYLFVVMDVTNAGEFLTYELNLEGWTPVDGESNVYYREVAASDADQSWYLLKGQGEGDLKNGYVTINPDLTLGDKMTLAATSKLSFTAYAIQKEGFATAKLAWEEVKNLG